MRKVFGSFCALGQVIKARQKDRVVRMERTLVVGDKRDLREALERSEDSGTLNTSFIERLKLVIRQGSAYLARRAASHMRSVRRLTEHLALFQSFYNFLRPHGGLRYGREDRTPAQEAGLATRRLSWRDIMGLPLLAPSCAFLVGLFQACRIRNPGLDWRANNSR